MSESSLTAEAVATATRRGALKLAQDPAMRHYSPDTLALVYERTVMNMVGAGTMENMAARMAEDTALSDVPLAAVMEIMSASFKCFAAALPTSDAAS